MFIFYMISSASQLEEILECLVVIAICVFQRIILIWSCRICLISQMLEGEDQQRLPSVIMNHEKNMRYLDT